MQWNYKAVRVRQPTRPVLQATKPWANHQCAGEAILARTLTLQVFLAKGADREIARTA